MKLTRRDVLKTAAAGMAVPAAFAAPAAKLAAQGKADACIYIWLGGGAGHIDTFDPKRRSKGQDDPGSYYDSIATAARDIRLCEHLPGVAARMDRCALLRTVSHDINSQHGAASNLMHTGRKPSGTIIYPSVGSIVSQELGSKSDDVPAYVVMGYPNIMRDPGFLGAKNGYVYLTQIETGPHRTQSRTRCHRRSPEAPRDFARSSPCGLSRPQRQRCHRSCQGRGQRAGLPHGRSAVHERV